MRENYFDQEIRNALKTAADHVDVSSRCKDRIDAQINCAEAMQSNGGSGHMKRWNWKKAVIAAVACCMLIGGTVFAAGKIVSIYSHSQSGYEITDYTGISKFEKDTGIEAEHVEVFTNGFRFDGANIVESEGNDEQGNTVSSWEEIMLTYVDDTGRTVSIDMEPYAVLNQDLSKDTLEERTVADISVYYNQVEYHLVPADYEATSEELERKESDPHYTISYGIDEERTEISSDVCFEMDGIKYLLLTFDDVSADELYSMAEEIITQVDVK